MFYFLICWWLVIRILTVLAGSHCRCSRTGVIVFTSAHCRHHTSSHVLHCQVKPAVNTSLYMTRRASIVKECVFRINTSVDFIQQELSYRKQIMHQLRTQYVEGIYVVLLMTLKPRSRVTRGHWIRNHWIDTTLLTISRVIWCWTLWSWNVGYRSLKITENGTIWKLGYGLLFAFHSYYGGICSCLSDI